MIFDMIEDLLGAAPNDFILGLYYVLGIVLIIFFMKIILILLRSIFNISGRKGGMY